MRQAVQTLVLISALLGALPGLAAQERTALTGVRHEVRAAIERDYAVRDGRRLSLHIFRPEGDGPHPVMICVMGGSWVDGRPWSEFAQAMAHEGVAGVSFEMRTSWPNPHPAQLEDVHRVIQTVRHRAAEWDLDPERIGLAGVSSGGHLATLAAYRDDAADPWAEDPVARPSTRVRCLLSMSAPLSFEGVDRDAITETQWLIVRRYLGFPRRTELHELDAEQERILRDASPEAHVSRDDPPVFLLHETADELVPADQAITFFRAVEAAGIPNDWAAVAARAHGSYLASIPFGRSARRGSKTPSFWVKIRGFLREHLLAAPDKGDLLRAPAEDLLPRLHEAVDARETSALRGVRARLAAMAAADASGASSPHATRAAVLRALIDALVMLEDASDGALIAPFIGAEGTDLPGLAFAAKEPSARWPLIRELVLHPRRGRREPWSAAFDLAWDHHRERLVRALVGGEVELTVRVTDKASEASSHPTVRTHPPAGLAPFNRQALYAVRAKAASDDPDEAVVAHLGDGRRITRRVGTVGETSPSESHEVALGAEAALEELTARVGVPRPRSFHLVWHGDADTMRSSLADARKERTVALRGLAAALMKRGWLPEGDVFAAPRVRVQLIDERSANAAPLPELTD